MFSQIVSRVAIVLAWVVGVVVALKTIVAFLNAVIGPQLTADIVAGAVNLWDYLTPGLTPLISLMLLVGIGWLFVGRRSR